MKISRDGALLVRKILIATLIIFIGSLLQTSFFAVLRPFGVVPDLLLVLCLGAGYFCGAAKGGAFGIGAGVVGYALGDSGSAFIILLYFAVGTAAGLLVESFFAGKLPVWCLYVGGATILKALYNLFCCVAFSGELRLWTAIWKTVLPEILVTFILGVALYYPVKKLIIKYI